MKKFCLLLFFSVSTLLFLPIYAQSQPPTPEAKPSLTKFDLDFPGGTPGELVAAIQKAMGRPLNAIIPSYYADKRLPALKMKEVDVARLFKALSRATMHMVQLTPGIQSDSMMGFRTEDGSNDDAVWYFYVEGNPPPPQSCRFYLITPYLEQGLTVDDITTAVQTAWKVRGDSPMPTLNFHKETKLLIGVGYDFQLGTIDDVLRALGRPNAAEKTDAAGAEKKTSS